MSLFNKYLITSMSSTFLYQFYNTQHIKIRRNNQKNTRLLLGEKILIICYSTSIAPIFFPFNICSMLNKIDNKINHIIDEPNEPASSILNIIYG
jgi:hypothetical protein